jgi:AMMECR1 domain-containing protein
MFTNKKNLSVGVMCVLCSLGAGALAGESSGPATRVASPAPSLPAADQSYLIRVIRRALADMTAGRRGGVPTDVPAAVVSLRCPVAVTLRRGGFPLALGQSDGTTSVIEGCRAAAADALRKAPNSQKLTESTLKQLGVEVELLGTAEPLEVEFSTVHRLARHYQPGVDGVAIRLGDRSSLILPSQIIANGLSVEGAIDFVLARLGLTVDELTKRKKDAVCMRFRTLLLWQPTQDTPVVQLDRGCTLIGQEQVSADHLDRAIRQIARYMRDRQRGDGLFAYSYLPWADRLEEAGPTIAQAGAAWALARHGVWARDADSTGAAKRAIEALTQRLALIGPGSAGQAADKGGASPAGSRPSGLAYLKAPDQVHRLGATAMLLLAATEIEPPDPYRDLRHRLTAAIITRQLPTGMMQTNFVTTYRAAPQETDPGEALLALARAYVLDRSPAALSVVENAYDHYQKQFGVQPVTDMVPWQACAYVQVARVTQNPRYVDYVFGMLDWLERFQLTPDKCDSPLMQGGIDPLGYGVAGITTAPQMSAVADGLSLARQVKDRVRAERYTRMLRAGTRFVLQLQFRPEECYYVRSRVDAIGGIRATPWDHSLTIENCREALIALMKARDNLFGRRAASR